ncbi:MULTISPECIES: hypothetical protein [Marinobacter]|uniref:Uncharacterized protein n=1 Tax=Marinobacter salinisoli TaxID=2769486 RepID=A0ABX7MUF2_9GAMM|nr:MULTISPECIES: hypothetical protein [Marinobacter]MBZ2169042.1 hypothetical protein [Marinobacter sp. F4216]QSP95075.1 hypothetical protein LPB19_01235 [Marinobacter salinisoli]
MLLLLVSEDDMQAIAERAYSRDYLIAYFEQMARDGNPLKAPQWIKDTLLRPAPSHTEDPDKNVDWESNWQAAHALFLNHLMACPACLAPRDRYCPQGARLRSGYRWAYEQTEV